MRHSIESLVESTIISHSTLTVSSTFATDPTYAAITILLSVSAQWLTLNLN